MASRWWRAAHALGGGCFLYVAIFVVVAKVAVDQDLPWLLVGAGGFWPALLLATAVVFGVAWLRDGKPDDDRIVPAALLWFLSVCMLGLVILVILALTELADGLP